MSRCVIIGGAEIARHGFAASRLRADDFFVCCDSGFRHCGRLGVTPHLLVGDFDSAENPNIDTETLVLPREKDDTDTVFAVREALRRGFDEFLLLGASGDRLDHTLGNISILLWLDSLGKKALLVDDYSEIQVVSRKPAFVSDDALFFSLLSVDGTAKGVSIRNAKYELNDAEISCEWQYGISNEVPKGKLSEVSVREGRLLLVKVFFA